MGVSILTFSLSQLAMPVFPLFLLR